MSATTSNGDDSGKKETKKVFTQRSAADIQRFKLEKLLKNPNKPVFIPDKSEPKLPRVFNPPEFVRNIWGSSAGAGSGDFHVYRGIRRREYARQKFMTIKAKKDELDEEFQKRLAAHKKEAVEKTDKKRAKRLKKKQKAKAAKKKKPMNKTTADDATNKKSDDDDDEDDRSDESGNEDRNSATDDCAAAADNKCNTSGTSLLPCSNNHCDNVTDKNDCDTDDDENVNSQMVKKSDNERSCTDSDS